MRPKGIMGHHISAIVLRGPFDEERAKSFDMKFIRLSDELVLFPLNANYIYHWSEKLGISGFAADIPLLNSNVVHHMVNTIAENPLFAIIETDYFGGTGSQAAAVYQGGIELMPPISTAIGRMSASVGPINKALRHLGVVGTYGDDEFSTIGLGRFRDFSDLFDAYESD